MLWLSQLWIIAQVYGDLNIIINVTAFKLVRYLTFWVYITVHNRAPVVGIQGDVGWILPK